MAEELIGGYRLLKNMATGQTSQVWEVVEDSSGRHFAMKLLLPEKCDDADHREFCCHEANVGKEWLIRTSSASSRSSQRAPIPYFVMEYFPAGSLRLRIQRGTRTRFPP